MKNTDTKKTWDQGDTDGQRDAVIGNPDTSKTMAAGSYKIGYVEGYATGLRAVAGGHHMDGDLLVVPGKYAL